MRSRKPSCDRSFECRTYSYVESLFATHRAYLLLEKSVFSLSEIHKNELYKILTRQRPKCSWIFEPLILIASLLWLGPILLRPEQINFVFLQNLIPSTLLHRIKVVNWNRTSSTRLLDVTVVSSIKKKKEFHIFQVQNSEFFVRGIL